MKTIPYESPEFECNGEKKENCERAPAEAESDRIEVHMAGGIMSMHGTRDLHTNGE